MIVLVLSLIITGLVVGALGRLVIRGRNRMGLLATIAVGLAGSFLGGLVGEIVFNGAGGPLLRLVLAVAGAAVIVWLLERSRAASVGRPI